APAGEGRRGGLDTPVFAAPPTPASGRGKPCSLGFCDSLSSGRRSACSELSTRRLRGGRLGVSRLTALRRTRSEALEFLVGAARRFRTELRSREQGASSAPRLRA